MEELHLLVQEEGRASKHAAFSVPVTESMTSPQSEPDQSRVWSKKPPATPRLDSKNEDSLPIRTKRLSESGAQKSRNRSASAGRDKKTEHHISHWSFLQSNLMRIMEDIFDVCEKSENVDDCKVVMLMLENYVRDFKGLIQYFNVKWRYENTALPERPTSLAWEVRRTSPSKVFSVLRTLKDKGNPEEMRACLVSYLAQELRLTRAYGLSAADIAKVASESVGIPPTKLNMFETAPTKNIPDEPSQSSTVVDSDELAKPLESDTTLERRIDSDVIPITATECLSVSSQTEDTNKQTVETPVQQQQEAKEILEENTVSKKEEACQTDALLVGSYTLDLSEEAKTCTEIIPATSTAPQVEPPKPVKTPSRMAAVRPSMAAPLTRGIARPMPRGRGVMNDVRPSSAQPRLLRSTTESRVGLPARGLARKTLEPRVRPATTNGVLSMRQPTARLGPAALATLPNRPNIGVGRGVKKLPERVIKNGAPTRGPVGISGRELDLEKTFGEQRSNSSSSLNSSSSRSSWADKVRGGNLPPNLMTSNEIHSVDDLLQRSATVVPNEDDGWKMVKVRSRSKISPGNKYETKLSQSSTNIKNELISKTSIKPFAQSRFNQPSAARSLPSLSLNVATKTVSKTVTPPSKLLNSQVTKKSSSTNKASSKLVKTEKNNNEKTSIPEGQREKITDKVNNKKNLKDGEKKSASSDLKNKVDLHKRKESLNNATNEKVKEFEIKKECDEVVLEIKKDSKEIVLSPIKPTESLESESPSSTIDLVAPVGSCSEKGDSDREEEEQQRRFDDEVRRKTEELCAEEARLEQQIKELETEVDLETEETEIDVDNPLDFSDRLHAQYPMLKDLLPAEQSDMLEQLRELEVRQPGRALELHQKLSSPSRRRNLQESLQCFQAKQAKAQAKRAQLKQDKWFKLQDLNKKIEEVRAAQTQNTELKREQLELKLKRAEEKRNRHLQEIARKAHDEEEKLKEIAFINELEAQNKRHDFMALCQEQEERLQGIKEERQRKQEEKAAKEAAVEERKKLLDAERQAKLEEWQEKRRRKEERIDRELQEKEKERLELAREKARDRDQRLQALQAAQIANQEELQKKIQAKQEEYARRHEENIEQIRQRALECCFMRTDVAPRLAPYETHKLCTLCNVLIGSDVYLVSHLRGRQHQEAVKLQLGGKDVSREDLEVFSLRHITDAPASNTDRKLAMDRERQKALKKRCKKIRLRMAAKGDEYENKVKITAKQESPHLPRLQKCVRDVERLLVAQGKGLWSDQAITSLERALAEIGRILDKKNRHDQDQFVALGGFKILSELFSLAMEGSNGGQLYLPAKCFLTVCNAYTLACSGNPLLCCHVVLSNKISTIMDLLLHRLTSAMPTRGNRHGNAGSGGGSNSTPNSSLPVDNFSGSLMRLLAMLLEMAVDQSLSRDCQEEQHAQLAPRVQDIVSYAVSAGVFEKLAAYCGGVRDPIDEDQPGALFLLAALRLLRALVACARTGGPAAIRQDVSQLGATLRVTELVGGVSMLYGMLLHQGATPRGPGATPPPLPAHTVHVARATLRLLLEVAEMDLALFQGVLGSEGMSLQFRHLSSYLLWACQGVQGHADLLLQDVVRVVGFFAVRNHDNQMTIQSGFTPTVLQQLCTLPFEYFMEEERIRVLMPTLLACCWDNPETRAVLEQELSFQQLEDFRVSEAGRQDSLVSLLQSETTSPPAP